MDKTGLATLTLAAVAFVAVPTALHLVDTRLIANDSQRVQCDTRCYAPTARVTLYDDRTEVSFRSGDISATRIEDSNNDGLADVTQLATLGPARAMGGALIGYKRPSTPEEQALFSYLLSGYQRK